MLSLVKSSTRSAPRRKWDDGIPLVLRPLVRAYLLGYASAVAPRLLTLLLQLLTRLKHGGTGRKHTTAATTQDAEKARGHRRLRQGGDGSLLASLQRILR